MASGDARPVPQKNVAYRVYFEIRKKDGTLITTWAGMDSEVSKDGGSFTDCTNEATEIGTTGVGYIDLTSTEMNADNVTLKTTVTNTDALPVVIPLYPEEAGDIRVNVTQINSVSYADTYAAKVWVIDDNANTTDRYGCIWFKNGIRITSGITSPTIQVWKMSDGADLIAETAMTEAGTTESFRKDEGTNRMVSGALYTALVKATIDGSSREWPQPLGRDST